jgi:mevalonate kinase
MARPHEITAVSAIAPGKVILFGEHAINRGQPALAMAVGLYARCRITRGATAATYRFKSGEHEQEVARADLFELGKQVDGYRKANDYAAIQKLAADDYFAPAKYILAGIGTAIPDALDFTWTSDVPISSGLGSGGSAFAAMVTAVTKLIPQQTTMDQKADWAHRGDVVAHGGIASALDTQASLIGGVIRYIGRGLADRVPCAPRLAVVIGNTGIKASTAEVNNKVREWVAERPDSRQSYFETIGALTRTGLNIIQRGDWAELGRLMNMNQLVLEKIGVSSPELEKLIDAAWAKGALGAKLSGSGGGGIIIALATPQNKQAVADAITYAGGTALVPEVPVAGARVDEEETKR